MPFGRNLFIGTAVAAGIIVVARVVSKNGADGGMLRTLVKNVMKTAMMAGEKLVEGTASFKENLEDLAAEARAEMKSAAYVTTKADATPDVSVQ